MVRASLRIAAWASFGVVAFVLTGCFAHAYDIADLSHLSEKERSQVDSIAIYSQEQLRLINHEVLKPVSGASVRHLLWDPSPSRHTALEQVKFRAWSVGANGISQVTFRAGGTDYGTNVWASVECKALAIRVHNDEGEPDDQADAFAPLAIHISPPKPDRKPAPSQILAHLADAVVSIRTDRSHGTAFVISADGYLITARHVVGTKRKVEVRFLGGRTAYGEIIRTDRGTDSALLKLTDNIDGLAAAPVDTTTYPDAGQDVLVIGSPVSMALTHTITRGIVSGVRKTDHATLIQTDAAINPGNSGGPLVDARGTVIGMVTIKLVGNRLEGLGFAVPLYDIFNALKLVAVD